MFPLYLDCITPVPCPSSPKGLLCESVSDPATHPQTLHSHKVRLPSKHPSRTHPSVTDVIAYRTSSVVPPGPSLSGPVCVVTQELPLERRDPYIDSNGVFGPLFYPRLKRPHAKKTLHSKHTSSVDRSRKVQNKVITTSLDRDQDNQP